MRTGYPWYSILVIVVLFVGVLVQFGIAGMMAIDNPIRELDDEVPDSWPYLSERNWFWSLVLGGAAFFGLALSMVVGVV